MLVIVQSLAVYFGLGFALYFLGKIASQRQRYHLQFGHRLGFWTWEIAASLFLFALVSGVRWNVGVDHQSYLREYLHAQNSGKTIKDFEIGFRLFTEGLAASGLHYAFYFFSLAFLQLFFVYRTFKDERYLFPYIGLTVVLGFHYLSWMNGIRQMLAATIFLFSIQYIARRKPLTYFALILSASLIHKSSIVLAPLYFIPKKDFFANRYMTVMVSAICLYIGRDPNWIALVEKYMSLILGWVGYERYSENLSFYVERSNELNFGPRMLVNYALFLLLVSYSRTLKDKFSATNFLMYYNVYIVGFLLYNLFINSHHVFLRPITYLTICGLPAVAYLLVYCSRSSRDYAFRFAAVLALASSYTPLSVVADYGLGEKDYSNYKFFWVYDER